MWIAAFIMYTCKTILTLIIQQKKRGKEYAKFYFQHTQQFRKPHFLRGSFVVGHLIPPAAGGREEAVATPYIDAHLCHKRFLCMLVCLLRQRENPTQIPNAIYASYLILDCRFASQSKRVLEYHSLLGLFPPDFFKGLRIYLEFS